MVERPMALIIPNADDISLKLCRSGVDNWDNYLPGRFPMIMIHKFQAFHANILFRWILYFRSQPLVANKKPTIVVAPHQDDETFGCGGMIALKRERLVPVKVIFMTDGRNGSQQCIKPDDIIQIRRCEATTALAILGVSPADIHFLNQVDGNLSDLRMEQRQHTINQLVQLLKSFKPGEIYLPHRKDRHRDHEVTYELVQAAISKAGIRVELFQYPIRIFWQAPIFFDLKLREMAGAYRLSVASVQEKKRRAIETYRSQIAILPRGFRRQFFIPYEIFFKTNPR